MKTRPGMRKISLVAGCVLIVCSLLLLVGWQWAMSGAAKSSASYVETLRTLLPEPEAAVPEELSSKEMPVLSIGGVDFVGILELHGAALPICADWDERLLYPGCYAGSLYDGSMKIGATSQRGQLDFYREISVGDAIYVTDMTGSRYSYTVTDILYRKHADNEALDRGEADLTLFVKNLYALEYVILYCKTGA